MFETHRALSVLQKLARVNWLVIVLVLLLAGTGVATLYSVAGGSFEPWAQRHAVRCAAGVAVLLGCALVPVKVWMQAAVPVYLAALALLAAVPLIGSEAMGAKRWLSLGGTTIQPSEFMKVALVLVLARFYAALPAASVSRLRWVGVPLALMAVPIVLTLKQPDLGTAMLFAGLGLGMMFLAGVSVWYFAAGLVGVLAVLPQVGAHLHDYQRKRIEIFLDPASDPLGAGYHITQAKIALGAGGLNGQGYLKGTQNQLDFVPEKMTDFIFAMIGEEWGFTGACMVLGLFALLIGTLFVMAFGSRQGFSRLVIAGAALSVSIYVLINVGMVTGLVPVVGVPLPLISYGGTAMLGMMVALGLAMSAYVHEGQR
ncbi:MAG: rod shape-determining protein RodA [Hyphomicrobiaceae bacterium]